MLCSLPSSPDVASHENSLVHHCLKGLPAFHNIVTSLMMIIIMMIDMLYPNSRGFYTCKPRKEKLAQNLSTKLYIDMYKALKRNSPTNTPVPTRVELTNQGDHRHVIQVQAIDVYTTTSPFAICLVSPVVDLSCTKLYVEGLHPPYEAPLSSSEPATESKP